MAGLFITWTAQRRAAAAVFMQCDPVIWTKRGCGRINRSGLPVWLWRAWRESKKINDDPRPKVILSASGMCDAGRIRHHLKHNLWRWENVISFAAIMRATTGTEPLSGAKPSACSGEEISVSSLRPARHKRVCTDRATFPRQIHIPR